MTGYFGIKFKWIDDRQLQRFANHRLTSEHAGIGHGILTAADLPIKFLAISLHQRITAYPNCLQRLVLNILLC